MEFNDKDCPIAFGILSLIVFSAATLYYSKDQTASEMCSHNELWLVTLASLCMHVAVLVCCLIYLALFAGENNTAAICLCMCVICVLLVSEISVFSMEFNKKDCMTMLTAEPGNEDGGSTPHLLLMIVSGLFILVDVILCLVLIAANVACFSQD